MTHLLQLALSLLSLSARRSLRQVALAAFLFGLAGLCAAIGCIGLMAALWLVLATALDPLRACLIIGAGGLILALLLVLFARARLRRVWREVPQIVAPLVDAAGAQDETTKTWGPVAIAAIIGLVLGHGRPRG